MNGLEHLPIDFLWGTATAGHQVEGDNSASDWWHFERARGLEPSGSAARFLDHFETDLDLAAALGTNAFRFSVEWARVEPEPGQIDRAALARYAAVAEACWTRGLAPTVTLAHFTLPAWAHRGRGWADSGVRARFAGHVERVARALGDRVALWLTVNEPAAVANAGYIAGVFPPGRLVRPDLAAACLRGQIEAHVAAARVLRHHSDAPIGIAKHACAWEPSPWEPTGALRRWGQRFNWGFVDALIARAPETIDWLGLNYYTSVRADPVALARMGGSLQRLAGPDRTDMGWRIHPAGLTALLVEARARYGLPLVVTESGIADRADQMRGDYIEAHVLAAVEAVRRGVDLRGFFYWSLIDNFEWHEGFWPRFGLVEVDYATQARTLRASSDRYRSIIAAHSRAAVS